MGRWGGGGGGGSEDGKAGAETTTLRLLGLYAVFLLKQRRQ